MLSVQPPLKDPLLVPVAVSESVESQAPMVDSISPIGNAACVYNESLKADEESIEEKSVISIIQEEKEEIETIVDAPVVAATTADTDKLGEVLSTTSGADVEKETASSTGEEKLSQDEAKETTDSEVELSEDNEKMVEDGEFLSTASKEEVSTGDEDAKPLDGEAIGSKEPIKGEEQLSQKEPLDVMDSTTEISQEEKTSEKEIAEVLEPTVSSPMEVLESKVDEKMDQSSNKLLAPFPMKLVRSFQKKPREIDLHTLGRSKSIGDEPIEKKSDPPQSGSMQEKRKGSGIPLVRRLSFRGKKAQKDQQPATTTKNNRSEESSGKPPVRASLPPKAPRPSKPLSEKKLLRDDIKMESDGFIPPIEYNESLISTRSMDSRAKQSGKIGLVAEMATRKEDGSLESAPIFKRSGRSETLFESSAKPIAEMDLDPVLDIKQPKVNLQVEILAAEVDRVNSSNPEDENTTEAYPNKNIVEKKQSGSVIEDDCSPSAGSKAEQGSEGIAASTDDEVILIVEKIVEDQREDPVVVSAAEDVEVSIFQQICCGWTLYSVGSTTA